MAAPPPSTALGDAPFDIQRSPFEAFPAGFDDAAALQAAILAATQPVAGAKRQRPDGGDTAAAEPAAPTPPRVGAGKHRPPRPPVLALPDSGSLESQALTPGRCGPSPRLAARSPRSPTGGASPGSRRAGKPLSKTQGRVCIECAATTTTQVSRDRGRGGGRGSWGRGAASSKPCLFDARRLLWWLLLLLLYASCWCYLPGRQCA